MHKMTPKAQVNIGAYKAVSMQICTADSGGYFLTRGNTHSKFVNIEILTVLIVSIRIGIYIFLYMLDGCDLSPLKKKIY